MALSIYYMLLMSPFSIFLRVFFARFTFVYTIVILRYLILVIPVYLFNNQYFRIDLLNR